jgi:hypothetical protein
VKSLKKEHSKRIVEASKIRLGNKFFEVQEKIYFEFFLNLKRPRRIYRKKKGKSKNIEK